MLTGILSEPMITRLNQIAWGGLWFLCFLFASVIGRGIVRGTLRRLCVNPSVVSLASQTLFCALLVIGIVTGLGTMGVNVSALVASLGLGGFALGFALRDAIGNVLAGALILIYQPFRTGQRISVAGFEGEVEEVNLRYTFLKAGGDRFLIPNQMLFTHPVKVHGKDSPPPKPAT